MITNTEELVCPCPPSVKPLKLTHSAELTPFSDNQKENYICPSLLKSKSENCGKAVKKQKKTVLSFLSLKQNKKGNNGQIQEKGITIFK